MVSSRWRHALGAAAAAGAQEVEVEEDGRPEEDQGEWAGILFLTPNPIHDAGTACYLKKEDCWQYHLDRETGEESDYYPVIDMGAGNIYNRLVLYRGKYLDHSSIKPGFGETLETSRLTQTFWFDVK